MYIYVYLYIYTHMIYIYIYIYVYTYRDRERDIDIYIYVHVYTCIYIYIYILEGTKGTLGKGPVQKIGVRYVSLCFESRCLQTSNAQGGWVTACDAGGLMGFLACCLATLLAGCMATRVAASRLHGQLPGCLVGMGILIRIYV